MTAACVNVYAPTGERVNVLGNQWRDAYTFPERAPAFRIWDGMTITDNPRQRVTNYRAAPDFTADDELRGILETMVSEYAALYSDDKIAELFAGAEDGQISTAGDCWYCLFMDPEELDNGHLVAHMLEGYALVSLVHNAYKARGYGDPALVMTLDATRGVNIGGSGRGLRAEVTRYMLGRLVPHGIPAVSLDDIAAEREQVA